MRNFFLIAVAAMFSFGVANVALAQRVVHVYNWSDYMDEDVLDEFEAETGIKVVYDVYDSNEFLETKLLSGGSGYDVVVPSATFMSRQIQAGVFRELDYAKLSNAGNQWAVIQARTDTYDPGGKYSVNYMWGTTGFGYNVAMIKERMPDAPVNSVRMLFDPEVVANFADCGVHVLDAPAELIPAALNYLGYDPDSHDVAKIEEATELLVAIRPHVRKFHSSAYIDALANGDICLAFGWSGDVFQARDAADNAAAGNEIVYVIPEEGALMWFDMLAVPADAPHPDEAHEFINYLLRPEVIAKVSNYVYYANGNLPSQQFVDEEVIGDPAIYPDEATLANLFTTTAYPPKVQRVVTRAWTKVKTGQ